MNKDAIKSALAAIPTGDFLEKSTEFLGTIGYRSELTLELSGTVHDFFEEFPPLTPNTKTEQEFRKYAESAQIIFQFTKDEIEEGPQQITMLESTAFDKGNIKSFLFCAVELKDNTYSRTKYAEFTREINKRLFAPTVILFRVGNRLTVAFADRRPDKTDEDRDVLGQVTLIKDIRLNNPHRAHLDILSELSLEECLKWMNGNRKPKNFDGLLAAWLAKLDTEELNKQFYRKLFAWYEWAIEIAKFPTDENRVIKSEEHVIRLITRLLFIWFIKEKGLVADALFNKAQIRDLLTEDDFDNGDSYYRAVLQNLFFATQGRSPFERAALYFIYNKVGYCGKTIEGRKVWIADFYCDIDDGEPMQVRGKTHQRVIPTAILEFYEKYHKVLKIQFDVCEFATSLERHPDCLAFCDPPYPAEQKLYPLDLTRPFTETDHWRLYKILDARENWILCYNNHEMIMDYYKDYHMIRVNKNNGINNCERVEVLILSHDVARKYEIDSQLTLF